MVLSFYADEKSVVKLTTSALHLMHFNNKLRLDFAMPNKIFEDQRFASIYDYADAHRRLICAMAICVKIFPLTLSQHMDTQTVDKMFQCFDYHDDQNLILLALVACRLFCCDDEIEPLFMAKCSPNHVLKLYPFLASKNNDVSTNATYVFGSFIKKLENNASDTVSLIFPAFNQFIQNTKKSFEAENLLDFSKTMLMRDIYQKHGSLELLEKMCVLNQTQSINYLL
ncbi:hypothetical protein M3Y97_01112400 [Aphelenchoides bicaudatus]|nr:hypothetical protein M3Y97_01112400 [Aphelenchoides bicaudatus]